MSEKPTSSTRKTTMFGFGAAVAARMNARNASSVSERVFMGRAGRIQDPRARRPAATALVLASPKTRKIPPAPRAGWRRGRFVFGSSNRRDLRHVDHMRGALGAVVGFGGVGMRGEAVALKALDEMRLGSGGPECN